MKNIILNGFVEAPDYGNIDSFNKAVTANGWAVFTDKDITDFMTDLDNLIKKGEVSALNQEELDIIEKAKKDISKLVLKTVVDKNGKTTKKWVKPSDTDKPGYAAGREKYKDWTAEQHTEQAKKHESEAMTKRMANDPNGVIEASGRAEFHNTMAKEKSSTKPNVTGDPDNSVDQPIKINGHEIVQGRSASVDHFKFVDEKKVVDILKEKMLGGFGEIAEMGKKLGVHTFAWARPDIKLFEALGVPNTNTGIKASKEMSDALKNASKYGGVHYGNEMYSKKLWNKAKSSLVKEGKLELTDTPENHKGQYKYYKLKA